MLALQTLAVRYQHLNAEIQLLSGEMDRLTASHAPALRAHMLGFGGHFSTKSRRYSTTLGHCGAPEWPMRSDGGEVTPFPWMRGDDRGRPGRDRRRLLVLRRLRQSDDRRGVVGRLGSGSD